MLTNENVENARCHTCLYYRGDNEDYGKCIFHAPSPQAARQSFTESEQAIGWMPYVDWPLVLDGDVCGKYEQIVLPKEPTETHT